MTERAHGTLVAPPVGAARWLVFAYCGLGAALLGTAGAGIAPRTACGRWLGYLASALPFVGIPIGTLLGGLMIWHLTEYRAAFVRGGLRRAT